MSERQGTMTTEMAACVDVHERFVERYATVLAGGEPMAWLVSPDRQIVCTPEGAPKSIDPNELIARVDAAWPAPRRGQGPLIDLSGGRWALALAHRQGSRLLATTIVVYSGAAESAAELRAVFADQARIGGDARKIGEFNERLETAYERINLLCRLARELNTDDPPAQRARAALQMLRGVLPFRWLAVRFHPRRHAAAAELAGKTFVGGELPFAQAKLAGLCEPLLATEDVEQDWRRVLTVETSALARMCGGEVIAQAITRERTVTGVVLAGGKTGPDPDANSEDLLILGAVAEHLATFQESVSRFAELRELFFGTVRALTGTIDAKDPYTRGHSQRVAHLAERMALAMGMGPRIGERYRIAGLVHDVGKIGVPEVVLRKPGKLTEQEFALIKLHPETGYRILKEIGAAMDDVLPGVLHHHEKWNGQGYPHGLAGEAIPLIARVLALADTFDAMCSSRSYRKAIPREQVLAEIRRCAGTQFEPRLAEVFVGLDFREFDRLLGGEQPESLAAA
jgi:HD-GYP domain-containing protein (c-di-GMP phosphodiesterase class II)